MLELRIHGYGGQGTVTMAALIAAAGLAAGFQSQTLPFFGVERRGSPVKAAVRLNKGEIRMRSQSVEPDYLIVMNKNLLSLALEGGIKPSNGRILLNAVNNDLEQVVDFPVSYVDADGIALKEGLVHGGEPYANIPMFGAVCHYLDLPKEVIRPVLLNKWPGDIGNKNADVAEMGYDALVVAK